MPSDAFRGRRILVVEDDHELREVVAETFRVYGAEVREAADGHAAFALFTAKPFDAVVSDVRMPECDGPTLLDLIRARDPRTPPFVFLTGYSDLSPDAAFARGAQKVLVKPFDASTLALSVLELLDD